MIQVNAIGDACPLPVIKTMHALQELGGAGKVVIIQATPGNTRGELIGIVVAKSSGVGVEGLGFASRSIPPRRSPTTSLPAAM